MRVIFFVLLFFGTLVFSTFPHLLISARDYWDGKESVTLTADSLLLLGPVHLAGLVRASKVTEGSKIFDRGKSGTELSGPIYVGIYYVL